MQTSTQRLNRIPNHQTHGCPIHDLGLEPLQNHCNVCGCIEPPTRYTTIKLSGTSGHHIHQIMKLMRNNGFESESKPKWNKYPEQQHGHIYTVYLKVPISDTQQTLIEQVVEAIR